MTKFLDLNYYFTDIDSPNEVINAYQANLGYLKYLPNSFKKYVFYRSRIDKHILNEGINYVFTKGKFLRQLGIPFNYHSIINKEQPDFILIHGMGYGLYSFFLKRSLPIRTKIIVQVHGFAQAPKGIKRQLFKYFDKYIDGYIFTGIKNAESWNKAGIFDEDKVFEVMEGSTNFKVIPEIKRENQSFIFVGRLNQNKDPITVLKAFKEYLNDQPNAKLTLVYNSNELLDTVKSLISSANQLEKSVVLLGSVKHHELQTLYNKHQFFVLGSHYEGSGYALMEAMACGCVPIVTNIPSFNFMTNDGKCAMQFSPGNDEELLLALKNTRTIDYKHLQFMVLEQFKNKLSHKAIANDIVDAFNYVSSKKHE